MIRRNRTQVSSLFLLELILAILFFAIASAVCVQIFIKSHLLSEDARLLNHAVSEAGNAAELLTSCDSMEDAIELLLEQYPQADSSDGTAAADVQIFYDADLQLCDAADAVHTLSIHLQTENRMLTASLSIATRDQAEPVYTLDVKHYLQRRGIDAER